MNYREQILYTKKQQLSFFDWYPTCFLLYLYVNEEFSLDKKSFFQNRDEKRNAYNADRL